MGVLSVVAGLSAGLRYVAIITGLCAAVYTQVSDVEDELNGLLTYDRRELKLTPEDIAETVSKLCDESHNN